MSNARRRLTLITAALALGTALVGISPGSTAHADEIEIVRTPTGVFSRTSNCTSGADVVGVPNLPTAGAVRTGGAGYFHLEAPVDTWAEHSLPVRSSLGLEEYQVWVRTDQPSLRFVAGIQPTGEPSSSTRFVRVEVPVTPGAWTLVDLAATTFDWLPDGPVSFAVPAEDTGSLADYLAERGDGQLRPALWLEACAAPVSVDLDAAQVRSAAASVVTDYEPATPPGTSLARTPGTRTIVAGSRVELGARLVAASSGPVRARSLSLQRAARGSSAWASAASRTTSDDGSVAAGVTPVRNTSYRWTFAGDGWFARSTSARGEVVVRTRVSSRLDDSTVRKGRLIMVRGSTYPAKPGHVVALRRVTSTSSAVIARTTVNRYGRFVLSKRVQSRGTWRVRATVAAGAGNATGFGAILSARVL